MASTRARRGAAGSLATAVVMAMSLGLPGAARAVTAGPDDLGAILLVVDASGSMKKPAADGAPRMDGARTALKQLTAELPAGTPVGLRVFGEGAALGATPESCTDSRLAAPVSPLDPVAMSAAIDSIAPRGWTPIGHALAQAGADMAAVDQATVVLISDGLDTCSPDFGPEPCEVARTYAGGPVDLQVYTIGLAVDEAARAQLECIASATGGQYFAASDAQSLIDALRATVPAPPRQLSPVVITEPANPMDVSPLVMLFVVATCAAGAGLAIRSAVEHRRGRYW